MKSYQKTLLLVILLPILLSASCGLRLQKKPSIPHLVTRVQVICTGNGNTMTRHYTQPAKVTAILNYLRLLKTQGAADTDPEQLTGDRFEITLYYSDGQQRIYRQQSNRYLSKNARAWEKVDPQQAQLLYPMLLEMLSDP